MLFCNKMLLLFPQIFKFLLAILQFILGVTNRYLNCLLIYFYSPQLTVTRNKPIISPACPCLPLSITWSLQGRGVTVQGGSESGIATAPMGPRASFLSIQSVGSQHSGTYTCTARNKAGNSSYSTTLMVNGNCIWLDRDVVLIFTGGGGLPPNIWLRLK